MSANFVEIDKLKQIIKDEVIVRKTDQKIVSSSGGESNWLFDFRRVILKPDYLNLFADIFFDFYKKSYPFQVGGEETAAIPLVAAIVMKGNELGMPVNGFYFRKSRKVDGLQKIVEGEVNDAKIILVDDLINSGKTFVRQLETLEKLGKKVSHIFTLVNFWDLTDYAFLQDKNIELTSLISLPDLGMPFLGKKGEKLAKNNFDVVWYFQSPNPNYFYVVPKSTPVLDAEKIYFGSDSGNFWALNQSDGAVAWKYKVGWHAKGKSIFSAPALYKDLIYFGAYDGNVYALNKSTGKPKWIFMEADWVGSSPAVAPDLNLLFIGLEFGLWNKRGGIVALDLNTGEKKWGYVMSQYVHSSPAYAPSKQVVAVGGNDSTVYLFRAKDGKLLWNHKVGGEVKASLAFSEKQDVLFFGAFDGKLYALDLAKGQEVFSYQTGSAIYSTPLVHDDKVFVSSMDKHLYCLDANTGEFLWKSNAGSRILSSPALIEGNIFVGANDGRMYELDPATGELLVFFQTVERITNRIVYNERTRRFFASTYANEIYCLVRK
ncbi:MAG: PQQ-binding-like beta-propeller repeat protein [bacterium]|nr:PQQ-binding-like beta-propeller repeat protein [bacterium]